LGDRAWEDRRRVEEEVMGRLAGVVAEATITGVYDHSGAHNDYKSAHIEAAELYSDDEVHDAYLNFVLARTLRMIRDPRR
jgi:hypothetical protein